MAFLILICGFVIKCLMVRVSILRIDLFFVVDVTNVSAMVQVCPVKPLISSIIGPVPWPPVLSWKSRRCWWSGILFILFLYPFTTLKKKIIKIIRFQENIIFTKPHKHTLFQRSTFPFLVHQLPVFILHSLIQLWW